MALNLTKRNVGSLIQGLEADLHFADGRPVPVLEEQAYLGIPHQ